MFKTLFNKTPTPETPQTVEPTNVSVKPTKKRKNTYVLNLKTMTCPGAFGLCAETPLPVVKINGQETENAHAGFMRCTQFPNPGAAQMEEQYHTAPEFRIIMGEPMASTIIEYLDKNTGKPALILYPTGHESSLIANEDVATVIRTRLNHASRRDYAFQRAKIDKKVDLLSPLINVRNLAMEQAPQPNTTAYYEFIAELDKFQTERAQQIVAQRQR